jgi:hypothetical protein
MLASAAGGIGHSLEHIGHDAEGRLNLGEALFDRAGCVRWGDKGNSAHVSSLHAWRVGTAGSSMAVDEPALAD